MGALFQDKTGRLTVGCNITLNLKNSSIGREPSFRELEHGNRGLAIVRSRYQATASEGTEDWKRLVKCGNQEWHCN
jgi:hypothetical protein